MKISIKQLIWTVLLFLSTLSFAQPIHQWSKNVASSSDYHYANGTTVDDNGNVYVTGQFSGTADFDQSGGAANVTSQGGDDIFLSKYDASGTLQWVKTIGGSSNDAGRAVKVDASGNVYITGEFLGTVDFDPSGSLAELTADIFDAFLAKYDANGNYVWAIKMGGSSFDYGTDLVIDGSNNIVVTGRFRGTGDFDPSANTVNLVNATGTYDIFFAKYDQNGGLLWAHGMGDSGDDQGFGITVDANDNLLITGQFAGTIDFDASGATNNLTSNANNDVFLAKYDLNGNYLWAINMGGSNNDYGNSVITDAAGNAYVVGEFFDSGDYDPSGNTVTLSHLGGGTNTFFAKYDPNGNYLWAHGIGASNGLDIALGPDNNVFITGGFFGTIDFDPGTGTENIAATATEVYLAEYDSLGNYMWAGNMLGTTGVSTGRSLASDYKGNIYVAGDFFGTVDFDPSGSTSNMISAGSALDGFLVNYFECSNSSSVLDVFACDSLTSPSGNYVWSSSNTYYDTIPNATGCDSLITINLTIVSLSLNASVSQNLTCFNSNDGIITGLLSGGYGDVTYSLDNVYFTQDNNFSDLLAGDYIVYARDSVGCSDSSVTLTLTNPAELLLGINKTDATCGDNNGAGVAIVSGGSGGGYQYSWSNGDTNFISSNLLAGTYDLTVIDSDNCQQSETVLISNIGAPSISDSVTNVSCNGLADGAINIDITGGTLPYDISWSNGSTLQNLSNLGVRNYVVTVTDGVNCTVNSSISVLEPEILDVSVNSTNAGCGFSDASATAITLGGMSPYSFIWSSSANITSVESNLGVGFYQLNVTDSSGCEDSVTFAISESGAPVITLNSIINMDCGANNGGIDVSITGGVQPYASQLWNGSITTEDITNATPGVYNLEVIDGANCKSLFTGEIDQLAPTNQVICLITVDSTTGKNLLIWEKPIIKGSLDHYNIYRENFTSNTYGFIGFQPFDSLTEFIDNTADPKVRSWRYKMSAIDTCGQESELSIDHKTIHLVLSTFAGDNYLSWDRYEGASYGSYNIWRDSDQTGWVKIDSIPGTIQSYTDIAPTGTNLDYFVEAVTDNSCSSTKAKTYGTTRSNRENAIASTAISTDFEGSAQIIVENDTIMFSDSSSGIPTQWTWTFDGGEPSTSTDQNPKIVYKTAGAYDVKLVAFNATSMDSIIKTGYVMVNPNGIGESAFAQINIYPNPSTGVFNIKLKRNRNEELKANVYTMFGELVKEVHVNSTTTEFSIDISAYATGVYSLNIISATGSYNFRIIKE